MIGWKTFKKVSDQAFTIVELLVVMVVIGILASIIFVSYSVVQNNANDSAVKSDLTQFADIINLIGLDGEQIPAGGATSSLTGDATLFPGIEVKPTVGSYDLTVNNLFYCAGDLGGTDEFGLAARSKSGKAFQYLSKGGITELTSLTWIAGVNGTAACGEMGFTAPYTWAYGFLPASGWSGWTY